MPNLFYFDLEYIFQDLCKHLVNDVSHPWYPPRFRDIFDPLALDMTTNIGFNIYNYYLTAKSASGYGRHSYPYPVKTT